MTDGNVKIENILKILKLLTRDDARLEKLLAEFLQQTAIREFVDEQPSEEAGKEGIPEEKSYD